MKKNTIVKIWKDEDYRNSLDPAVLAKVPEHPSGRVSLSEDALESVIGGLQQGTAQFAVCGEASSTFLTYICCPLPSSDPKEPVCQPVTQGPIGAI